MNKKKLLWIIPIVFLILLIFYLIHKTTLNYSAAEIKIFIRSLGFLGPFIFIILNIATIIFSPLTSFPLWIASLSLYGYFPTVIYVIISNSGGSVINFYLARRFGRPLVEKLAGKDLIKKIDEFAEIAGYDTLFVARLFGGATNDYISYAAGLTSMRFKPYFLISLFINIPSIFINLLLLRKAIALNPFFIALFGAWIYILAVIFPLFIFKMKKNQAKNISSSTRL